MFRENKASTTLWSSTFILLLAFQWVNSSSNVANSKSILPLLSSPSSQAESRQDVNKSLENNPNDFLFEKISSNNKTREDQLKKTVISPVFNNEKNSTTASDYNAYEISVKESSTESNNFTYDSPEILKLLPKVKVEELKDFLSSNNQTSSRGRTISFSGVNDLEQKKRLENVVSQKPYPYLKASTDASEIHTEVVTSISWKGRKIASANSDAEYESVVDPLSNTNEKFVENEPSVVLDDSLQNPINIPFYQSFSLPRKIGANGTFVINIQNEDDDNKTEKEVEIDDEDTESTTCPNNEEEEETTTVRPSTTTEKTKKVSKTTTTKSTTAKPQTTTTTTEKEETTTEVTTTESKSTTQQETESTTETEATTKLTKPSTKSETTETETSTTAVTLPSTSTTGETKNIESTVEVTENEPKSPTTKKSAPKQTTKMETTEEITESDTSSTKTTAGQTTDVDISTTGKDHQSTKEVTQDITETESEPMTSSKSTNKQTTESETEKTSLTSEVTETELQNLTTTITKTKSPKETPVTSTESSTSSEPETTTLKSSKLTTTETTPTTESLVTKVSTSRTEVTTGETLEGEETSSITSTTKASTKNTEIDRETSTQSASTTTVSPIITTMATTESTLATSGTTKTVSGRNEEDKTSVTKDSFFPFTIPEDGATIMVRIVVQGPWHEACTKMPDMKQSLAQLVNESENDRKINANQIYIFNSTDDCSGYLSSQPSTSTAAGISSDNPQETQLTTVLVFVIDENGKFDVDLTKKLPSMYKSQASIKYPLTIKEFEIVYKAEEESNIVNLILEIVSAAAIITLILLTALVFIMRKRQTRFNYGERCRPISLDAYSLDSVSAYNSVRRSNNKAGIRASKRSYGNPAFEDSSVTPSHPLNFAGLSSFSNDPNAMAEEFSNIPQISSKIEELPMGAEVKNRYANVIPLPETRVPLQRLNGDPITEYINASYVRGPKNATKYYIACQAPTENTVSDFWRMIWEQQSKVIIMLTDLVENGVEKCVEYIPPSEISDCHRLFGDYQVTVKKRETKEKYAISTLQLKNLENNTFREVYHIWYLWPSNATPSDSAALISVLLEARALQRGGPGPIVVHCSPGTGRTGTIIALDLAIRQYEITRTVDVPRVVYTIRRDRAGAVQTKQQYAFIYKALNFYAAKLAGCHVESA